VNVIIRTMRVYLFFLVLVSVTSIYGQDKVKLKNGEKVYGTIISYEANGKLILKRDKEEVTLLSDDVANIKWKKLGDYPAFKNKGYFNETSMGFMLGNDRWGSLTGNFTMLMNQGIILREKIGLGVSAGVETWNSALRFPAIFNARYYFGSGELNPYVGVRGGYMISGKIKIDENIDPWWSSIPDNSHGPTTGFQVGIRKGLDQSFGISGSIGFRYQKFIRDTGWGGINYTDMYRFEARIGLFFN